MADSLFVYGTLAPGCPNEHILTDIGGSWQKAEVTGTLLEKGRGADMGYPGIVLNDKGPLIEGYVFTSKALKDHWPSLDEFEGAAYQRVLTKAKLNTGDFIDTYVYALTDVL